MQDEALRTRSAAVAARLAAETFVWENEARKFVDTYERALATMSDNRARRAGPHCV